MDNMEEMIVLDAEATSYAVAEGGDDDILEGC